MKRSYLCHFFLGVQFIRLDPATLHTHVEEGDMAQRNHMKILFCVYVVNKVGMIAWISEYCHKGNTLQLLQLYCNVRM